MVTAVLPFSLLPCDPLFRTRICATLGCNYHTPVRIVVYSSDDKSEQLLIRGGRLDVRLCGYNLTPPGEATVAKRHNGRGDMDEEVIDIF